MKEKPHRKGSLRSHRFASGIQLHIADFVPTAMIEQRFESQNPLLRFYFHIAAEGYWELQSRFRIRSKDPWIHSDRLSSVLFYPELEGKMVLPEKCRQFHLSIYVPPALLSTHLGGGAEQLPKDLRFISEGCVDRGYAHGGPLSGMMHQAIEQILDCPYTGSMKSLYMEGKAMELIAHKLAQTASAPNRHGPTIRQDLPDAERIRHARDILCRDLENPPRLFELAHAVGTNHCRLNIGFRNHYGTTVFGYLRRMRLAEARRMLEEEGRNVTETALSVGYNSLSSFTKAFTDHFGRQPISYRKKNP